MNHRARLAALLLFLGSGPLCAQGMLPGTKPSATVSVSTATPLLIGERVPDLLTFDLQGSSRTLISYKDPLDAMVVAFMSASCAQTELAQKEWKRFYKAYKDWGVLFVAVETDSAEPAEKLVEILKKDNLPAGSSGLGIPVLRDTGNSLAHRFGITHSPAFVIIDEGLTLRYRGPLDRSSRQAMEAVISHQEPVDQSDVAVTTGCPVQ